jgi:hypothetical protein
MGVIANLQRWWADQKDRSAFEDLGHEAQEALSRDIGLSLPVLERIVARGSRAGAELPRLLRALGLDPDALARSSPEAMRQMLATCSACSVAKECRRDLEHAVARLTYQVYCPNAQTISVLETSAWRGRDGGSPNERSLG